MSQDFNKIEGNYSKEHVLKEYAAGRIPDLLKIIVCTVCEIPLGSELMPPLPYGEFVQFLADGVIQERNGHLTWVTDHSGREICEPCQSVMEAKDKEEGIVLFPPKKYSPF
jgi:hypothetical protein